MGSREARCRGRSFLGAAAMLLALSATLALAQTAPAAPSPPVPAFAEATAPAGYYVAPAEDGSGRTNRHAAERAVLVERGHAVLAWRSHT